ncbi:dienelactone hydrolase family protein [Bacteroidia bacterium]|nr:dienelactone hydrolase family protein [Bacteroidia bacterium]
MNKLFYFALIVVLASSACNTSSDSGKLGEVAKSVELLSSGTITFPSKDGLEITADYYPNESAMKIIILCHQAGFSRAEYRDIAPRLVDSGFACLAIDQRSGKLVNEVFNETAKAAETKGLSTKYIDSKIDIEAAIDFVAENTEKEIYVWGSSYSASLALMIGNEDERVKKVIAFSPGEYLGNQNTVRPAIEGLSKPVFITGGSLEYDLVVKQIVEVLPLQNLTTFKPEGASDHGSKTLWMVGENTDLTYQKLFDFL